MTDPIATHADRNLLVGVLALQMDFISREALIAAVSSWIVDKSRPLEEYLNEQGALADDERQLLSALVQKHIENHHNNPRNSLAAVGSIGLLHSELMQLNDPEVEATLGHFVDAQQVSDTDPYKTSPYETPPGQRFRILRPHASGGLGQVSVARDEELNREVALKELHAVHRDHPDSRSRFLLEAEITGSLEHPGIVPIYGLGQFGDGRPFYAMRFIKGGSLQQAIERFHSTEHRDVGERTFELRKLLGRFVDVCNAVEYAHSRGVLHRDLKPGNIMLGKYGETLVVDWGLAKPLGLRERHSESDESTLKPGSGGAPTLMGSAIGTPAYMSPEQACGKLDELGQATDVYSLGATLYCLLTGNPPFSAQDVGAILSAVREGALSPPRAIKNWIPPPLESICLTAMAHDPKQRYASPIDFADDLERWLADEPIKVYREGFAESIGRLSRKHRSATKAVVTATLLITLMTAAMAIIFNVQRGQVATLASTNADFARKQTKARELAETQRDEVKRQLHVSEARRLIADSISARKKHPQLAVLLAAEAVKATRESRAQPLTAAIQALYDAYAAVGGTPLGVPTDTIKTAAITEDRASLITVGSNGSARIWALSPKPHILKEISLGRDAVAMEWLYNDILSAVSSDRNWLAIRDSEYYGDVRLWDLSASPPRQLSLFTKELTETTNAVEQRVAFSPDARWLFTSTTREVFAWDLTSGLPGDARFSAAPPITADHAYAYSFAVSPNNKWLAVGGQGGLSLVKLDRKAQEADTLKLVFDDSGRIAQSVSFSKDSNWVLAGSDEGTLTCWPIADSSASPSSPCWAVESGCTSISSIAVSPDNRFTIVCGNEVLGIVEPASGKTPLFSNETPETRVLLDNGEAMGKLSLSSDGTRLAAVDFRAGTAHAWKIVREGHDIILKEEAILRGHDGEVLDVYVSESDPDHLVTFARGQPPRSWQLSAKPTRHSAELRATGHIASMAVSPDCTQLVVALRNRPAIDVWDMTQMEQSPSTVRLDENPVQVAFSNNGEWLAIADKDGGVRLRRTSDLSSATADIALTGRNKGVSDLQFSSDDRWITTLSSTGDELNKRGLRKVEVWDLQATSPSESARLLEETGGIDSAIFADDVILTAGNESKAESGVEVWRVTDDSPALSHVTRSTGEWKQGFSRNSRWFICHAKKGQSRVFDLSKHLFEDGLQVEATVARGTLAYSKILFFNDESSFHALDVASGTVTDYSVPGSFARKGRAVAVSPDGAWAAIGSESGSVGIWRLDNSDSTRPQLVHCSEFPISGVGFSPSGRILATGDSTGTVRVWDFQSLRETADSRLLLELPNCGHAPHRLTFSTSNGWLLASSDFGPITVWKIHKDFQQGRRTAFAPNAQIMKGARLSPDERWLVTSETENSDGLLLWDLENAAEKTFIALARGSPKAAAFSADTHWLAADVVSSSDGGDAMAELLVWDLRSESPRESQVTLRAKSGHRVYDLRFSRDGNSLAAVYSDAGGDLYSDATYAVWDRTGGHWSLRCTVPCARQHVYDADISPDSLWLSCYVHRPARRCVTRWQLENTSPRPQRVFLDDFSTVGSRPGDPRACDRLPVAFSPNGRWLVTESGAGEFYDMRTKTRTFARTAPFPEQRSAEFRSVQFSPDNEWLVATSYQDSWLLYTPGHPEGQQYHHIAGGWATISPNGRQIATVETEFSEATVRLTDIASPDRSVEFKTPHRVYDECVFSKDGHWLFAGGGDRITGWNLDINELVSQAEKVAGRRLTTQEKNDFALMRH